MKRVSPAVLPAVRRKILHSKIPGSEQLGEIAHSHQGPHFDDIWDRWGKFMLERERVTAWRLWKILELLLETQHIVNTLMSVV